MALVATQLIAAADRKPDLRFVPVSLAYLAGDTYATGGFSLTPTSIGLSVILGVIPLKTSGYMIQYDTANQKLMLFRQSAATSALTEVANAVDVSGASPLQFLAVGQVV